EQVESNKTTWLEHINFVHDAIPELNLEDLVVSSEFLGKLISAPIIIGAMTGGTELTKKINISLAKAAQKFRIPMMVGSQRVILRHPETKPTFSAVREAAPDIPIVGNIGIAQVATSENFDYVREVVDNIKADAIAIHLNVIQELIQPEGDKIFAGAIENIKKLKKEYDIPIVMKETGCGISKETAQIFSDIEVEVIDVSGLGGTSWVAVEYYRAKKEQMQSKMELGKIYWDWGIPTAASIIEVKAGVYKNPNIKIIGSGGIRTGIDIAKSIRIGADYAALARPFLMAALDGGRAIDTFIEKLVNELKITMLLTGSKTIEELKSVPIIIDAALKEWLERRNINLNSL
ncbi:MAG: type 2 isopentenyl-diphosphate Delta-isomerase, partial [Candidatus Lokiarchaeota archaeon]|nr:type 2 isopentenyl-diphosphate Delta-isomerase [Candidatus Lokiarchaeota archaeon]MBD3199020.1 type 2 isopentenyl-diphosphate Delta-isomerase [Candidatus Lokiarchaeota archaeon]